MLLLGTYYFLYVEVSDFYVNQSLAGQTVLPFSFKWLLYVPF
jgi:hypothetical protein